MQYTKYFFRPHNFDKKMNMMQYLLDLDEDSLFHIDEDNKNPLCYIVNEDIINPNNSLHLKTLEYLLKRGISARKTCSTIGGLFHEVADDDFVLRRLINRLGKEEVWDCIHKVLSSITFKDDKYPMILHQTPEHVDQVFVRFPDSMYDRNTVHNRLPIHIALDRGMEWGHSLMTILHANNNHLEVNDPMTKLPLHALAAKEPSCDLKTIYYLIRKNPDCVDGAVKKYLLKKEQEKQTPKFQSIKRKRTDD